ncbi:MAG TPA: hypothetical protein VFO97_04550 [Desertimonas sp.]|nr:hypothetical protein [Desertimonas sp.]
MSFQRPLTAAVVVGILAVTAVACGDDDNATVDSTESPSIDAAPTTDAPAAPEPETTVPETSDPESAAPPSSAPGECAEEPTEETADDLLVGLTEDEATEAAEVCGWILRVVRRDREELPMTMDLRPNRVNVEVTDGEVTAIVSTG